MACTEKNYWYTPDAKQHADRTRFVRGPHRGITGRKTLSSGGKSDKLYYRGQLWLGPTNAVGQRGPQGRLELIRLDTGTFGLVPA